MGEQIGLEIYPLTFRAEAGWGRDGGGKLLFLPTYRYLSRGRCMLVMHAQVAERYTQRRLQRGQVEDQAVVQTLILQTGRIVHAAGWNPAPISVRNLEILLLLGRLEGP